MKFSINDMEDFDVPEGLLLPSEIKGGDKYITLIIRPSFYKKYQLHMQLM